jgi:arginine exporter protein ArgO
MMERSHFGNSVFVVFTIAQLADGILTYLGVHVFGQSIEANPILSWYIAALGAGMALLVAKTLAVGCASALHLNARHRTIGVLTVFYLAVAVWPWATLFSEAVG